MSYFISSTMILILYSLCVDGNDGTIERWNSLAQTLKFHFRVLLFAVEMDRPRDVHCQNILHQFLYVYINAISFPGHQLCMNMPTLAAGQNNRHEDHVEDKDYNFQGNIFRQI